MEELFESFVSSLREKKRFPGSGIPPPSKKKKKRKKLVVFDGAQKRKRRHRL
jgi:hypothetical protein